MNPDISLATKSGHFYLLTTSPVGPPLAPEHSGSVMKRYNSSLPRDSSLQTLDVRTNYQLRLVFLGTGIGGAMIGLALVLFAWNNSWNHSTARWILWNTCYPLLWVTDRLLRLFFTHERIGPSFIQVLLFDCLFVLFCGLTLGAACTTAAGALRFICRRFRTRTG